MCSKPIFCSKVAKKDKICSRLLELQKIAPNAKSCSKVAEHNRERPNYDVKLPNSTSYGERGYVTQGFCFFFQLIPSSGKFVNSWKTEEMKWKLEIWNSANSLSSVAFSLPKGLVSNLGLKNLFPAPTQWGRTGSRKGARKLCGGWGESE